MVTTLSVEHLTDDLLLVVDQVRDGVVDDLSSRAADRIADALVPAVAEWANKHKSQKKGAAAAADIAAAVTTEYVVTQALLSAGLLLWATEQTGVPMTEILSGVRAQRES